MANVNNAILQKKLLIRSVGLFWTVEDVYWGAGRNAGNLLGVPAKNTTAGPFDFRDQAGIYILYAAYDMVYVGQTGTQNSFLFNRLKYHTKDDLAGRWNRFSWFGLRWVKRDGNLSTVTAQVHPSLAQTLNHIEGILILASEPPLNRQGARFGKEVTRYVQRRDRRLGLSDRDLLISIQKAVEKLKMD